MILGLHHKLRGIARRGIFEKWCLTLNVQIHYTVIVCHKYININVRSIICWLYVNLSNSEHVEDISVGYLGMGDVSVSEI